MKYFNLVFTPTKNRRLNELIGFVLLVCAALSFLALSSYSPLDPSMNTAASGSTGSPARNWIGMGGAFASDLLLQVVGIAAFALPMMMGMLGVRWWKSRPVATPLAKCIGGASLMIFIPGLLALFPFHLRWLHALPIEGLLGRVVGDFMVHYFNVPGAYILSVSMIAVAMYLSTAFSFGALQLWFETRFGFAYALRDRYTDW